MDYKKITESFKESFELMRDRFGADETGFVTIPGKSKDGSNDISVGYLEFEKMHIELVYVTDARLFSQKSFLDCRIYLDKREKQVYFSPYEFTYTAFEGKRDVWFYPYIESPERMSACFRYLSLALIDSLGALEELSDDFDKCSELYSTLRTRINKFFGEDIFEEKITDPEFFDFRIAYYMKHRNNLFSSKNFILFLRGENPSTATRIVEMGCYPAFFDEMFLENLKGEEFPIGLSDDADTYKEYYAYTSPKRNFFSYFISTIALFPVILILFFALYRILLSVGFKDALYVTGGIFYGIQNLLPLSLMLSAALSPITHLWLFKLKGKKHTVKKNLYEMASTHQRKLSRVVSNILAVISIIAVALISCRNVAFYDTGFSDNTSVFSLAGKFYQYDEFDSVWEIKSDSSEESLSIYVIVIDKSKIINLSSFETESAIKEKILPILESRSVNIHLSKTLSDINDYLGLNSDEKTIE